jgi:membrane protein
VITGLPGARALGRAQRQMNRIPLKEVGPLLKVAVQNWQNDRAPRMGAALAYYIALSLAPTVLILVAIASLAFGTQAAEGRLVSQIRGLVGNEGAHAIQTMIEEARRSSKSIAATVIGLVTVFFAASAVVSELKDAMNTIWRVPEDTNSSTGRSIFNLVKERLVSFALVLASGLFLEVSLIVNAWIVAAGKYLNSGAAPPQAVIQITDAVVSLVIITALFALIFKLMPSVSLKWEDVALGAVFTSLLFTAGKFLLGIYLGKAGFTDTYGAAGSLVIILVWVYYSAQVLFLGAEFTRAYAFRFGSLCLPKDEAGAGPVRRLRQP